MERYEREPVPSLFTAELSEGGNGFALDLDTGIGCEWLNLISSCRIADVAEHIHHLGPHFYACASQVWIELRQLVFVLSKLDEIGVHLCFPAAVEFVGQVVDVFVLA